MSLSIGKLFGVQAAVRATHWKVEFSKALPGRVFRVCATTYSPTNPGPYNDETWQTKIAVVVICTWAILSVRLHRIQLQTPNAKVSGVPPKDATKGE